MCTIYNPVGCLREMNSYLQQHHINDIKSLDEIFEFHKNYETYRLKIISDHKHLIEDEKNQLDLLIPKLQASIEANKQSIEKRLLEEILQQERRYELLSQDDKSFISNIISSFKKWRLKSGIKKNQESFHQKVSDWLQTLHEQLNSKIDRQRFIETQFEAAVQQECSSLLVEQARKKRLLDGVNKTVYGALGELSVVKELQTLSDDSFVINDFRMFFHKSIYDHRNNEYINSIQVDHLLINRSGVFVIETKNWSKLSTERMDFFSPVRQIKRANFIVYKLLNGSVGNYSFNLAKHHWGKRNIPVRNIIAMTNSNSKETFEHVKILGINRLVGYISYFEPTLSPVEVNGIVDYLLKIGNGQL